MLIIPTRSSNNLTRRKLAENYRKDESLIVRELLALSNEDAITRAKIWTKARVLVVGIRAAEIKKGGVDALLNEFALSTEEGVVLMCLAEALLRVPDKITTDRLIRDKLNSGDWSAHLGNTESLFVNASAWGLVLTGKLVGYSNADKSESEWRRVSLLKQTLNRVGEPVIRAAMRYAMKIMGNQFVMGKNIDSALKRAKSQEANGYRYSYDMLGEAARTMIDADCYYDSYLNAIEKIGAIARLGGPVENPGISIKLSALHPRYSYSHHKTLMKEMVPRLKQLALAAKKYNIGFTIDAEEAARLETSLDIIAAVFEDPDLQGWEGFGIAVQAYQKRSIFLLDWITELAQKVGRKMMVRLVKGAYWDSEIKWAQEGGFVDYPVFTQKASTDLSYQVCAKKLLANREWLYPQFATHNAYTVAAILALDKGCSSHHRQGYEFQRLHGMGEALYDQVMEHEHISCRIYAPVGEHADLLAYLVRRLLENGANTSFVNNIVNEDIPVENLINDPVEIVKSWSQIANIAIPLPRDIYSASFDENGERENSAGVDLTSVNELEVLQEAMERWWSGLPCTQEEVVVVNPANRFEKIGALTYDTAVDIEQKLINAIGAQRDWSKVSVANRAILIRKLSDKLEENRTILFGLCIKEAGKTLADSVAEVREAVDFCRYYAEQAEYFYKHAEKKPLGVILCISPWNFPVAIFLGQIIAALSVGNTVIAKPSEQTSLVAIAILAMMKECGFPDGVIELVIGPGKPIGEQLAVDSRIRGVMFTGSTNTGRWLSQALAKREEVGIPLIAETGGQNVMIVDSTALPEQVVDDVIMSGFQSAGQRCSALRVLFLQEEVADKIIAMVSGAMRELSIGDPAHIDTDIGPVIDEVAFTGLQLHSYHLRNSDKRARLIYQCELTDSCEGGFFFPPTLFEISNLSVLKSEVFGPIVHVIRYKASDIDKVVDQINDLGFGLTLGIHSRIKAFSKRISERAKIGNIYVNRNMIGAVVGVQPFGGCGLSGTGPKAGGPNYLGRLVRVNSDCTSTENHITKKVDITAAVDPSKLKFLSGVIGQQSQWHSYPDHQKVSVIRRLKTSIVERSEQLLIVDIEAMMLIIENVINAAKEIVQEVINLPGPTGESNRLYYEARGTLALILAEDIDVEECIVKVVSALITGNQLVILSDSKNNMFVKWLLEALCAAGLPTGAAVSLSYAMGLPLLNDNRLNGLLMPNGSLLEKAMQRLLSERKGALIPIITSNDINELLIRLVVEKTVSIDTTAAGGNASLMTM